MDFLYYTENDFFTPFIIKKYESLLYSELIINIIFTTNIYIIIL